MTGVLEPGPGQDRRIGRHVGAQPGPLLVCVGGIHGNEPSGILAARAVLDELERGKIPFRGEFVALAGNLKALRSACRFLDRDLNREWVPDRIEAIRSGHETAGCPEDVEQRELLLAMEASIDPHGKSAYFLDLHTSSADGPPFITIGDTLRNRAFAKSFPIPGVLGLEDLIDGPLLEYMNNLGHVTLGVEGGRHDDPGSVPNLEAALWIALETAGNVARSDVPGFEEKRTRLARAAAGLPRLLEVHHRHPVAPEDAFRMNPGYRTLHAVSAGETVAFDRSGAVRVRDAGWLLLPLYQGQGNDGFFLSRELSLLDQALSAPLRRLGIPFVTHWLPGVRRHPKQEGVVLVNTRVARFYPAEVFHLLGYRKKRRQGDWLVMSRRLLKRRRA